MSNSVYGKKTAASRNGKKVSCTYCVLHNESFIVGIYSLDWLSIRTASLFRTQSLATAIAHHFNDKICCMASFLKHLS